MPNGEEEIQTVEGLEALLEEQKRSAEATEVPEQDLVQHAEGATNRIETLETQLLTEQAAKIRQAELASGLEPEQIVEVRRRFQLQAHLKNVSKRVKRTSKEYKQILYGFMAEKTGDRKYKYKEQLIRIELFDQDIRAMAEADLMGAIETFERETQNDEKFGKAYEIRRLSGFLIDKVREAILEEQNNDNFENALNFAVCLPKGEIREDAVDRVSTYCIERVKSNKIGVGELKKKVEAYADIVHGIWSKYSEKEIYPKAAVVTLIKDAVKAGDSRIIGGYLGELLYSRYYDEQLLADPDLQEITLRTLLENKDFLKIADNRYRLGDAFAGIKPEQLNEVVSALQNAYPKKLYKLKNDVELTVEQKQSIIEDWQKYKNYHNLLNPNVVAELQIPEKVRQEALNTVIEEDTKWLVKYGFKDYNLELTSEQKQRTLKKILNPIQNYSYRREDCKYLFNEQVINSLDIDSTTLRTLLTSYGNGQLGPHRFFSGYDWHVWDEQFNDEKRILYALRVVQGVEGHPNLRRAFLDLAYTNPGEALGVFASLKDEKILTGNSGKFRNHDEALQTITHLGEGAEELLELATTPPHLFEDPELAKCITSLKKLPHGTHREAWVQLIELLPELQKLPKEYLTTRVIETINNHPGSINIIRKALDELPDFTNNFALDVLCKNPQKADELVIFIKKHPKLTEESKNLGTILQWVVGKPEQTEAILYIQASAPELFWFYSNENKIITILENFALLKPILNSYTDVQQALEYKHSEDNCYFSKDCLQYLITNPQYIDSYTKVFKEFPGEDWNKFIAKNIGLLLTNPSSWPILHQVYEKDTEAIKTSLPLVTFYVKEPKLLILLDLPETQKSFVTHETLAYFAGHPENLQRFISVLKEVPESFSNDAFHRYFEQMLDDKTLKERLLAVHSKAPTLLNSSYTVELDYFLQNYSTIGGLLDKNVPNRKILFNMSTLGYLVDNPGQADACVELFNSFELNSTPWALLPYLDETLSNPQFKRDILSLAKRAPVLFQEHNNLSMRIFLDSYEDLRPLLGVKSVPMEKLLGEHAIRYLLKFPKNIQEYVNVLEQLPENIATNVLGSIFEVLVKRPEILARVVELSTVCSIFVTKGGILRTWVLDYDTFNPLLQNVKDWGFEAQLDVTDAEYLQTTPQSTRDSYYELLLKFGFSNAIENIPALVVGCANNLLSTEIKEKVLKDNWNYTEKVQIKSREVKYLIDSSTEITNNNWVKKLGAYAAVEGDEGLYISAEDKAVIEAAFGPGEQENKKFCLQKMQEIWKGFLESGGKNISLEGAIITNTINGYEGAGPLRYIESLAFLIHDLQNMKTGIFYGNRTSSAKQIAKRKITEGLLAQEGRFVKEKWSEDDKAIFYDISRDIIKAEPRLYTDFLELFSGKGERKGLSPQEMKTFFESSYPLFQAELVTLQKGYENNDYSVTDLAVIKKRLKHLIKDLEGKSKSERRETINKDRGISLAAIEASFKNRFGILKVPEKFDGERIRTMQNMVRFLGNMAERDADKEEKLSLFLGLMLNDKWDAFRQGEEIKLEDYFEGDKLENLKQYIERRKSLNQVTSKNIGIEAKDMQEFQRILQSETSNQITGNVETVDIKLGNILRNMEHLGDEDLFTNPVEHEAFPLFREHGEEIGKLLAKLFQQASGKNLSFTNDELLIQRQLERIFKVTEWTTNSVKEIQNKTKTINRVTNVLRNVQKNDVPGQIQELQSRLESNTSIVDIFNKLGEEFKQESGAIALTQDIAYLRDILNKNQDKLTEQETKQVHDYLDRINEQLQKLEESLGKIKAHFTQLEKSAHEDSNELLKNALADVEKIINSRQTSTAITTRVTNNLNLVIENMRKCLGCTYKGVNNDTNLTFGDSNKFYIMSQGAAEKASIADQVLFFSKVKHQGSEKEEMSFVLDQVYGTQSSDILISNVLAVLKKQKQLKTQFPDVKISTLVSNAAMTSVGLNSELLRTAVLAQNKELSAEPINGAIVTVAESAGGDHYVEFGGGTRTSGKRTVGGLVIR